MRLLLVLFFVEAIGNTPNNILDVGFKPMPPKMDDGTILIWYNVSDRYGVKKWVNVINCFLERYRDQNPTPLYNHFIYDYYCGVPRGGVYNVSVNDWYPCTSENGFGFYNSSPCVFLQMRPINDWTPQTYNTSTELLLNMPQDLTWYIQNQKFNPRELNAVWVSCEGVDIVDMENIGPIQYIPRRGYPHDYFPKSKIGYLDPLVAVYFENPKRGIMINIECKVWEKNITSSQRNSVRFKLIIDD